MDLEISFDSFNNHNFIAFSNNDLDKFKSDKKSNIIRNNRLKYFNKNYRWIEIKDILELFFDLLKKKQIVNILDIGCGYGDICFILNKIGFICKGTLIKSYSEDFAYVNQILQNDIVYFDLLKDNFSDLGKYDVVICNKVITLKSFTNQTCYVLDNLKNLSDNLILGYHMKMLNYHKDLSFDEFKILKQIKDKISLERII